GYRRGDLATAEALVERRVRDDRYAVEQVRRPVTFVGAADEQVEGTERRHDVGRGRQQRDDAHGSIIHDGRRRSGAPAASPPDYARAASAMASRVENSRAAAAGSSA